MDVKGEKLVFTQPEVVHILWNHENVSLSPQDSDKEKFIDEVTENYSLIRNSDAKGDNVTVGNIPPSRELLARRILQLVFSGTEHISTSTSEQLAQMKELHRIGRTAKAIMFRREMDELRKRQETDNLN